jgi:hypothetical protein
VVVAEGAHALEVVRLLDVGPGLGFDVVEGTPVADDQKTT